MKIVWSTICPSKMRNYTYIVIDNRQYNLNLVKSSGKIAIPNILIAHDFNIIFAQSPSRNIVFILSHAWNTAWKQEVKLCISSAHASPTVLQLELMEWKVKQWRRFCGLKNSRKVKLLLILHKLGNNPANDLLVNYRMLKNIKINTTKTGV